MEKLSNLVYSNGFRGLFWNAVYAGFSAIQPALILFVASRTVSLATCGIITIGFTLATLFMVIGNYGVRTFQVTDVNEEYKFQEYRTCRIFTVAGSFMLSGIYLMLMVMLGKYSLMKTLLIAEVVVLKLFDSYEGVYVGRLQQLGRLDLGSQIAALRTITASTAICVILLCKQDPYIAFGIGIMVSLLMDIVLLNCVKKECRISSQKINGEAVKRLLLLCLPLCIGTALHNYIGNAPKYLTDLFLTDEYSAITGYVMLPMFVVTLLNTFILQPTVKGLGEIWILGRNREFLKLMKRHISLILIFSIVVCLVSITFGLRLLGMVYHVDLQKYKWIFVLLLIGGTIYTICAYFIVVLTTMRKNKEIVYGCLAAVLIYIIFGKITMTRIGFQGAAWLYIITNSLMMFYYIGVTKKSLKNRGNTELLPSGKFPTKK